MRILGSRLVFAVTVLQTFGDVYYRYMRIFTGPSPARGVSFAGCLVLGVAAPGRCLWGGWLVLVTCTTIYFIVFSGAGFLCCGHV